MVAKRKQLWEAGKGPRLKLVLMSASLDTKTFEEYFKYIRGKMRVDLKIKVQVVDSITPFKITTHYVPPKNL